MENPYTLSDKQPTLQQLLDLYIDWRMFNDRNNLLDQGSCDSTLYLTLTCCDSHKSLIAQTEAFTSAFRRLWNHLGFSEFPHAGISIVLLKFMIKEQGLTVDVAKAEEAFCREPGEWESAPTLSALDLPIESYKVLTLKAKKKLASRRVDQDLNYRSSNLRQDLYKISYDLSWKIYRYQGQSPILIYLFTDIAALCFSYFGSPTIFNHRKKILKMTLDAFSSK